MLVELPFAGFFLSKLLGTSADVDIHHLASLDPEVYRNLLFLKSYEGDVEELGLNFTVVNNDLGEAQVSTARPGRRGLCAPTVRCPSLELLRCGGRRRGGRSPRGPGRTAVPALTVRGWPCGEPSRKARCRLPALASRALAGHGPGTRPPRATSPRSRPSLPGSWRPRPFLKKECVRDSNYFLRQQL